MARRRMYLFVVLVSLLGSSVYAQTTGTTGAPVPLDLAAKIGIVAAVVAAALQGLKKFMPQIGGIAAVLINIVLSVALSYAAHPSLDMQFFITSLAAAVSAAGIHSFLRPAGVMSTAAPTLPGKGS